MKVLDHGFIELVDHMGTDDDIAEAARVSYQKGTKKINNNAGLIRYLFKHAHFSPFEMVEMKFHIKAPIFVMRQAIRHRTWSTNEISARYSVLDNEFYIPETANIQKQSTDNKQGRAGDFPHDEKLDIRLLIEDHSAKSYALYESFLEKGLARELSRMVLPLNIYTQWYWKANLRNIFAFLKLRMDHHAQYEIRVLANAMYSLVKEKFPIATAAFDEYSNNTVAISASEKELFQQLIKMVGVDGVRELVNTLIDKESEKREFDKTWLGLEENQFVNT